MEISTGFVNTLEAGDTGTLIGTDSIWRGMLPDQIDYLNGAVLVIGFENREEAKQKTVATLHTLTITVYHADMDQIDAIVAAVQADLIDLEGDLGGGRLIKKTRMTLRSDPFYDDVKNMWAASMEFTTME